MWSATADQTGVHVTLDAPSEHVTATVVAGGIEQILDNLLDNAIRAAPPGTTVDVIVSTGSAAGHEPVSSISVGDQGAGLDDEEKRRALDRFWRADTTQMGTGLGLPIAQTIALASGGGIDLHDNRPSGLVVTVELPVGGNGDPRATRAEAPASDQG